MSAAKNALDALSVPPDQRWTPATWVNDDGEWVARGPKRTNRNPTPIPGESVEDYEARCFDEADNEPGCDGDRQAQADAERMCLAVNLSSPLAAVARAAMERPWIIDSHGDGWMYCFWCNGITRRVFGPGEKPFHFERCQFAKLDAALDALEAAAKEMTP